MHQVASRRPVGTLLRDWRRRRHLSQMDLALAADVSARHLSFLETGRSSPSAQMVLHLAEQLDVPLRERNELLLAAGYAPAYAKRPLDAPEMGPVRDALERVLEAHRPFPAVVIDAHWGMVSANDAVDLLTAGVDESLLEPPVNVLRLSLHPNGMAPRILNLGEWRDHLLTRLARESVAGGDPALAALHEELSAYPGGESRAGEPIEAAGIAVPLRLRTEAGELSFISTATSFGTATDITLAELSIEAFYPADRTTAEVLSEI